MATNSTTDPVPYAVPPHNSRESKRPRSRMTPSRFIPLRWSRPQARPESVAVQVLRYYPFTLLGTVLLAATAYLSASAFATQNNYEFILSAVAMLVLSVLATDGRVQAHRMADVKIFWDNRQPLIAQSPVSITFSAVGSRHPHYFYRLHTLVTGRLHASNQANAHLRAEISSASEEFPLKLELPVCGELAIRTRLTVRDMFGLTRSHLPRQDEHRLLTVRPGLLAMRSIPKINTTLGDETTRRRRSADEERFYMREYQPGDRLKDINWKASSRTNELITRIAPVGEDQTKLLHIELRHFRPPAAETLDSVLHLNYLKSWLLTFLHIIKTEHDNYTFRVITGTNEYSVKTFEEIDDLARNLASVSFAPYSEYRIDVQPHELFIFTTAYDAGITSYVSQFNDTVIHLYRTVSARSQRSGLRRTGDEERIRVPLFRPGHLVSTFPGAWVLGRDRFMTGPLVHGPNIHVEDNQLEISLS